MTIDEITSVATVCELCGKEFSCGAKTGKCWCFEVEIVAERLKSLKENFERCLCPQCLAEDCKILTDL